MNINDQMKFYISRVSSRPDSEEFTQEVLHMNVTKKVLDRIAADYGIKLSNIQMIEDNNYGYIRMYKNNEFVGEINIDAHMKK